MASAKPGRSALAPEARFFEHLVAAGAPQGIVLERQRLIGGGYARIAGSRRYRAFDDDLLPCPAFETLRSAGPLPFAVAPRFEDHLTERSLRLKEAAAAVAARARAGTLPEIRLDEAGLTITPLRALTPSTVKTVRQALYDRLPRVRVTDVLLDVDAWTGFSEYFTHRRTSRTCDDRAALLTCVLADGINLGLTRMAETCRGASLRQLALVHDWHVSEAAYAEALARLIDAQPEEALCVKAVQNKIFSYK